jgi:hypothetical protein
MMVEAEINELTLLPFDRLGPADSKIAIECISMLGTMLQLEHRPGRQIERDDDHLAARIADVVGLVVHGHLIPAWTIFSSR